MNKLTKISATALVALFLAACDKPAQKAPTAAETKPAETQAPAVTESKPAEVQAPTTTETNSAVEAPSAEAMADFQKLVAWNAEQEASIASSQAELQQKFATQDPKQIQEALSQFTQKVDEVVKSLDAINVSDAQLKVFKEKTKSVLVLSGELITDQIKAISTPDDQSLQQALQQKSQTLIESGTELQKLQNDLQQRFMAK